MCWSLVVIRGTAVSAASAFLLQRLTQGSDWFKYIIYQYWTTSNCSFHHSILYVYTFDISTSTTTWQFAFSVCLRNQFFHLHFSHLDSSDPSEQSSCPLHFNVPEIQRPFLQENSPALHFTLKERTNLWDLGLYNSAGTLFIYHNNLHVRFDLYPPQFSSSVLSPQSLAPSHSKYFGLQRPFLHLIWDALHSETTHTRFVF